MFGLISAAMKNEKIFGGFAFFITAGPFFIWAFRHKALDTRQLHANFGSIVFLSHPQYGPTIFVYI